VDVVHDPEFHVLLA
jgi:hypothetical protein